LFSIVQEVQELQWSEFLSHHIFHKGFDPVTGADGELAVFVVQGGLVLPFLRDASLYVRVFLSGIW